jgi:tRNA modification GTPase
MLEGLHKIVSTDETIVAISTPLGHSGLGIVRISGNDSTKVIRHFFKSDSQNFELTPRVATLGAWNDENGDPIDEVVITFFQGPRSYTGEDVVEISAHGNPIVLRKIVESVRIAGARLATPGEFTLRAVANGKMDLLQAEALRNFIEAQTEQQSKTAMRQMDGSLSRQIQPIKNKLIDLIARMEAGIDFAEDDVEVPSNDGIVDAIRPLQADLEKLRRSYDYGRILAQGFRLAILGKPNVGKSSLFNSLVSAERAIVTDTPGTTRDVLTETVSFDGVPLCFADTAGIRDTNDEVERIGVTRTWDTVSDADVALIVLDGSRRLDLDDERVLEKGRRIAHLIVVNKSDLPAVADLSVLNGSQRVVLSAKTGAGLEELRMALRANLLSRKTDLNDDLILTNVRQCDAVLTAGEALATAEAGLNAGVPHEMALLDLYRGLASLNELTGEVVTDDILDRIFSTFCIGK